MSSWTKTLFFLILFAFVLHSAAAEDALYVLSEDGTELAVVVGDSVQKNLTLDIPVRQLVPTPGGGYLFLLGDNGAYLALNAVSREIDRQGEFPITTVDWIRFGPTGHELYVQGSGQSLVFDHQKGLAENPRDSGMPLGNPVSFNRRGTRYYRSVGKKLEYRLLKDHSLIESVSLPGETQFWQPDPRFSTLWSVSDRGELIIVDENRAKILKKIRGFEPAQSIQFAGNRSHVLSEKGEQWISLDQRRFRQEDHIHFAADVSSLQWGGGFWYFTSPSGIQVWEGEPPSDQEGTSTVLNPGFPVRQSLFLELKQGEGFACF